MIRALSGRGQFRLCSDFSHYGVSTQVWVKMTSQQRRDIVSTFENAKLPRLQNAKDRPESIATPSSSGTILSVSAEDSGITSIPLVTLTSMWNKASELISTPNGITPAPGDDLKARMVLSRSQVVPHYVRSSSYGRYMCDKNCPQWISSQICSHTIAVAEQSKELLQFLQWYVSSGQRPNLSAISLSGLPKGRGQKGGKLKQKRVRPTTPAPDNYTLRPGLASAVPENFTGLDMPCSSQLQYNQPFSVSVNTQVLPGQFQQKTNSPVQQAQVCQQSCQTENQAQVYQPSPCHTTCEQPYVSPAAGPPPLINVTQPNMNPFYLKKLMGNIRICQGCRGTVRMADGSIPNPPHDVVVARLEKRQFRDQTGSLKTPYKPSAVHYHARLPCICAGDPSFVPSSLIIPPDVAALLTLQHHQLLRLEFRSDNL